VQDQNYTDIEKALIKAHELGYRECFVVGAIGGRLDHTFSAMHVATKICSKFPEMQLVLMGDDNLMFYLQKNIQYTIKISSDVSKEGCGLITLDKADMVETTGFKWNLGPNSEFHSLKWGEFISTSNII